MKTKIFHKSILLLSLTILSGIFFPAAAQTKMSAVMDTATLKEQLNYVQKHTKIYDNFRAIREDYFQKIKRNSLDSLKKEKKTVVSLNKTIDDLNKEVASLKEELSKTQQQLEEVTRTKDSLLFLGIRMNKAAYNVLLWGIITGLAVLLVILFLMYKRSHVVTVHTKRELEELKKEFEEYRKSTRERIEKMTISHHKEIQKLREGRG
jgi:uncharacterized membrane-anchored protein YhcB (DUF1043 family)